MEWPARPEPDREKSPPTHSRASARQPLPPAVQMAKAGGSPRCCPVLCGLRDRCIAAMLATLVPVRKDRDTKAELNRRGQACDFLTDTGISRRVKMVDHQGIARSIAAWKAGVYL